MATDNNNEGTDKGFAGLLSLLSDIDNIETQIEPEKPKTTPSRVLRQTTSPTTQTHQNSTQSNNTSTPGNSSGLQWLFGVGVVIVILWLVTVSNQNKTPSPSRINSTVQLPPGFVPLEETNSLPPSTAPQKHIKSRPTEEMPPARRNNVLNIAQLRYCHAEDIRLESAEKAVNLYSELDVTKFNMMVNDYNSRCGEFRYRPGTLENARRQVEEYRKEIEAEGRSRFVQAPLQKDSPSLETITGSSVDTTVLEIQKRLNDLGYNAGVADGLIGPRTKSAISAFLQDNELSNIGLTHADLLKYLNSINNKSSFSAQPSSPNTKDSEDQSLRLSKLSTEERQSIEYACSADKVMNGPAAYNTCLQAQLSRLRD